MCSLRGQGVNERLRKSHIVERMRRLESGDSIDWATAEALAMGTLLYQGVIQDVTARIMVHTCMVHMWCGQRLVLGLLQIRGL